MFNYLNAIEKDGGPEITRTENHLGSIENGEVDAIGSTMEFIQDLFGFIMGEETMQYGVDTMTI